MKQTPTGCEEYSEQITELLYGELDESARHTLLAHLEVCEHCSEQLERFEHVRSLMRSARSIDVPAGLEARVMSEARKAIETRVAAPVLPAAPDEKPTGFWTRLLSPATLRPALATAMTMLLVAGVAYLLAGREGSIVQRYTEKPSTQLPAELAPAPVPPNDETIVATHPATPPAEEESTIATASDEKESADVGLRAEPEKTPPEAATSKSAPVGGATGTELAASTKDTKKSGLMEDDLLANLPMADGSAMGTKTDSITSGFEGEISTSSAAKTGSSTYKTPTTPAPTSKPAPGAAKGGSAGLSESPAPDPAPSPSPGAAPPPAPAPAMAEFYDAEMDEVLATEDADDESPAKPAKETEKSGKKKESWLDKWKKKKAEKKAKKAKGKGTSAPSASAPSDSTAKPAEEKAVEQKPADPFEQAMALKKSKKYDDAIALLKTIKDKPTATKTSQAKVYHQLASCSAAAGHTSKALIYYENLFARFPSYAGRHKAMWDAALLYLKVGDKGPARDLLEKLLDIPAYADKAQKKLDSIK